MSGISDLPFRMLNRHFGCELAFVEMINVRSLGHRSIKTQQLLSTKKNDRPLGVQLLAGEAAFLRRALEILNRYTYDIVDFNAACPARKVTRRGEGSSLLKNPRKLSMLLAVLVRNTHVPVTVKIRTGWDREHINAVEVAKRCEDAGISGLFIHGRTKTQEYSGQVDYRTMREVKNALGIPVVASGDIFSAVLAKKMLDETACDGILVARGALGNPWIFQEISQYLKYGKMLEKPPLAVVLTTMKAHLKSCIDFYGERIGVTIFRKFFSCYIKGMRKIRPLRERAYRAKTQEEMLRILDECMPVAGGPAG
jgi:tRNA-dihydrouridine synthase B